MDRRRKLGMIGSNMEGNEISRRILLVDDDQKLCRLIGDYLEPLGYERIVSGTPIVEHAVI